MSDELKLRLESAKRRLDLYLAAEEAVLTGQEYSIGSRRLRRADLKEIKDNIVQLENKCIELQKQIDSNGKGPRKAFRIIPRDL
ncbi:MAG: hypothetical protein K0R80_1602 [Clostridia bacterium]|jgi:hypothetical protein|nr:hypothetical protein [Clostridia bacterium]